MLGFPRNLQGKEAKDFFPNEIHSLQNLLPDPWDARVSKEGPTVQIHVPKLPLSDSGPPPHIGVDNSAKEFAAALSVSRQGRHTVVLKRAVVKNNAARSASDDFEARLASIMSSTTKIGVNELTERDHDTDSAGVTCSMCYMVEVGKSERAKMRSCKCCGKKYHRNCLKQWAQHRDLFNWSSWACPSCRTCEETGTSLQTLTSAATMEHLGGGNIVQPSMSTKDALDKYHIVTQKISKMEDLVANNAGDGKIQEMVWLYFLKFLKSSLDVSAEEAALAVAQKASKALYENASSSLHVSANLAILVPICDVCKRVVKELTNGNKDMWIYF
ncbi:hypothetical protein Bca101_059005 [Brassica carinata]